MGKKIEYTNGELTIVWQPELCQHAGICVKMLPNVYHPKERPWVQIENATTEELIAQISKCPSKALVNISYSACTQFSAHVNTKSGSIR